MIAHAVVLYGCIEIPMATGVVQNLSSVNIANLVAWLTAIMLLLSMRQYPVANLFMIVAPLNVLALLATNYIEVMPFILATGKHAWQFAHIWLALLGASLMLIAAMQSTLFVVQEYRLKTKSRYLLQHFLPPLVVMEALFIRVLRYSFYVLSIFLILSLFSLQGLTHISLWKLALSLSAWVVLASYFSVVKFQDIPAIISALCTYFSLFLLIVANFSIH